MLAVNDLQIDIPTMEIDATASIDYQEIPDRNYILRPLKKSEFTIVGQPLNLRPVCIAKYFIFSCFDAGFAWLKFREPPRYFSLFLSGRSISSRIFVQGR